MLRGTLALVLGYWRAQQGNFHTPDAMRHPCLDTGKHSGISFTPSMLCGALAGYWRAQRDNFLTPDAMRGSLAGIIWGRAGIIAVSLVYWRVQRDSP